MYIFIHSFRNTFSIENKHTIFSKIVFRSTINFGPKQERIFFSSCPTTSKQQQQTPHKISIKMPRRSDATILKTGLPDLATLRAEVRAVLQKADRTRLTHKVLRRLVECRLRLAPKALDRVKTRVHDTAALMAEEVASGPTAAAKAGQKRGREEPAGAEEVIQMRVAEEKKIPAKKKRKTQQERFLSWMDGW